MDASMFKRHKTDNTEDRISELHESIISQILFRLPIEDAVQTAVLSKTWKSAWTALTTLRFADLRAKSPEQKKEFMEFVKSVLLRFGRSSISCFHFVSSNCFDASLVEQSLSSVFGWSVEKLGLYCNAYQNFNISLSSHNLLDSLVQLNISATATVRVSNPLHFAKLKVLNFALLTISNESPFSGELLFHAPFLENFETDDCLWLNSNTITIDSPSLRVFHMCSSVYKDVHEGPVNCEIKILAPYLTTFHYAGDFFEDFVLTHPSSVLDATFEFNETISHAREQQAYNLLKQFTCSRELLIQAPRTFGKSIGLCVYSGANGLSFEDLRKNRNSAQNEIFMELVKSVLLHIGRSAGRGFHFNSYNRFDASLVESSLSCVFGWSIEELSMYCDTHQNFDLSLSSRNLLDSLVNLKISATATLRVSNPLHFAKLKVLNFARLTISNRVPFLWTAALPGPFPRKFSDG